VRDVLWQALATVGLVVVVVFFVRNRVGQHGQGGHRVRLPVPVARFGHRGAVQPDRLQALRHHPGAAGTGVVNTLWCPPCRSSSRPSSVHGRAAAAVAQLLLSTLAAAYIEFVRNIPLLFFVLFWYFGVLAACRRRG
jgi:general L-amino acid transport system permease protein